jgi:hypothetical protein
LQYRLIYSTDIGRNLPFVPVSNSAPDWPLSLQMLLLEEWNPERLETAIEYQQGRKKREGIS